MFRKMSSGAAMLGVAAVATLSATLFPAVANASDEPVACGQAAADYQDASFVGYLQDGAEFSKLSVKFSADTLHLEIYGDGDDEATSKIDAEFAVEAKGLSWSTELKSGDDTEPSFTFHYASRDRHCDDATATPTMLAGVITEAKNEKFLQTFVLYKAPDA